MASRSSNASCLGQRPAGRRDRQPPVASQKKWLQEIETAPKDEQSVADKKAGGEATNQQEKEKASPGGQKSPQPPSTKNQSGGASKPLSSAGSHEEGKARLQDTAKKPTSPTSKNREITLAAKQANNDVNGDKLVLGLLNARSVKSGRRQKNKQAAIKDAISAKHIDVMAITETWHDASDLRPLQMCAPDGYRVLDAARPSRGGGIALLFADRFVDGRQRSRCLAAG